MLDDLNLVQQSTEEEATMSAQASHPNTWRISPMTSCGVRFLSELAVNIAPPDTARAHNVAGHMLSMYERGEVIQHLRKANMTTIPRHSDRDDTTRYCAKAGMGYPDMVAWSLRPSAHENAERWRLTASPSYFYGHVTSLTSRRRRAVNRMGERLAASS